MATAIMIADCKNHCVVRAAFTVIRSAQLRWVGLITSASRKNVHAANLFERREESAELALVGSFRDQIQSVLALDYRFAPDPNTEPRRCRAWDQTVGPLGPGICRTTEVRSRA